MVECSRCHKELTQEELDMGFNSNMYENKFCMQCIKELEPEQNEEDFEIDEQD